MLSAKISKEFKNSGISTPIFSSRPTRDPYQSLKFQQCQNLVLPHGSVVCIVLPSLVYTYFNLDIEQDEKCRALLIKQEASILD